MRAIATVFRFELSRQLRRNGYLFVSFGLPLIAIVLFFGIRTISQADTGGGSAPVAPSQPQIGENSPFRQVRPLGYVDLSGLLDPSPFTNLTQFPSVDAARAALERDEIASYFVVAADYLESGRVDMYFDRFNLANMDNGPIRMLIVQSLARLNPNGGQIPPTLISQLQARELQINGQAISVEGDVSQKNENTAVTLVYVFAFVLMFTAFTTSSYLMQSVVEEKENRMVEVLMSSMRPRDLLAGKFLSMSVLGLLQMALWLGTAVFLLTRIADLSPTLAGITVTTGQLAVMVLYFFLGYMLFAAAYAAIGALASNMREGPQFAAVVTVPAVIPLYLAPVIAVTPNAPLAVAASIFPLTAPLGMVMRISATPDVPLSEIVLSAVLLAATVVGIIWLAGRLFRVNTLLAGQPPKLRDLVRLVRESA